MVSHVINNKLNKIKSAIKYVSWILKKIIKLISYL